MKSENVIKVSIDTWGVGFKVTCGDTSREFKTPHWQTAGFVIGFALWLKENDWVCATAFKNHDEKAVAEAMLDYVTRALEQKQAYCGYPQCSTQVVWNTENVIVNDNPYYQVLNGIESMILCERESDCNPQGVWEALVREELKRAQGTI